MSVRPSTFFRDLLWRLNYNIRADVSVAPDDVCIICKEPYNTSIPPSAQGCRPIQLLPCMHIVGDACFSEWAKRQPEKCIYWTHKLRFVRRDPTKHELCCIRLLGAITNSGWFICRERVLLHKWIFIRESRSLRPWALRNLAVLLSTYYILDLIYAGVQVLWVHFLFKLTVLASRLVVAIDKSQFSYDLLKRDLWTVNYLNGAALQLLLYWMIVNTTAFFTVLFSILFISKSKKAWARN